MSDLLTRAKAGQAQLLVPDAVVAQVWRTGSGRQSRLSVLLGLPSEQCRRLPLDTTAARRIGSAIGTTGHTDVVDVHVALVAIENGAAVITSDRSDLVAVDPRLASRIVDI